MTTGRKDYWLSALVTQSTYDIDVDVPPNQYIWGWISPDGPWKKLICTADGKLIIDLTALFENPPTEDETKKAATSEWTYDHWKNAAAHHAKYTDTNARAAISNILDASGELTADLIFNRHNISKLEGLYFSGLQDGNLKGKVWYSGAFYKYYFVGYDAGNNLHAVGLKLYNGVDYDTVCTEEVADTKIGTHKDIVAAHHTKYTNLEAQTACNLNGNLYWSCSGSSFNANYPMSDNVGKLTIGKLTALADGINLVAPVNLPNGATVTAVIVFGNASAEAETWGLRRIKLSDASVNTLATALIGTEDTSINYATIDNSIYSYYLFTGSLDTNDEIWGARITYTL